MRRARLLIDGSWVEGPETFPVTDKFSGEVIGHADRASREQVNAAVAAADASFRTNRIDGYERFSILRRVGELIEQRRSEIAATITAEAGFPVADAQNEVTRAIQTFLISAEEFARRAVQAILRRDRYRTIPWQMGIAAALLRRMPRPLYDRVFEKAPRKPRRAQSTGGEADGLPSPREGGASW